MQIPVTQQSRFEKDKYSTQSNRKEIRHQVETNQINRVLSQNNSDSTDFYGTSSMFTSGTSEEIEIGNVHL